MLDYANVQLTNTAVKKAVRVGRRKWIFILVQQITLRLDCPFRKSTRQIWGGLNQPVFFQAGHCLLESILQIGIRRWHRGSGPWACVHLGGPRQRLRVDIFPDVRQFAISDGNCEDPIVLERLIRGYDSPLSEADDQNPVSLRYEFKGLWE
jgi:hypothetical protein